MILGLDFSLTGTGVCAITDGEAECVTITSRPETDWYRFPERVERIADQIIEWGEPRGDTLIVIESPAFLAKGSGLDRIFGGWWMLVAELQHHVADPLIRVAPAQLKKWATGRGNANKDEVMLAVARKFPDVTVEDNNQTDALVLAAIGAALVDEPFNPVLTKAQAEIIDVLRVKERK